MIEMLYSEPHQAISAFVGVVCTTRDYCPEIESVERHTKFILKSDQPGGARTEWEALGKATRIDRVDGEIARLLRAIWPKPERWLSDNEELWWLPAIPLDLGARDRLLERYRMEVLAAAQQDSAANRAVLEEP